MSTNIVTGRNIVVFILLASTYFNIYYLHSLSSALKRLHSAPPSNDINIGRYNRFFTMIFNKVLDTSIQVFVWYNNK